MLAKTQPPKIRVLIIDDSRLIRSATMKMFGDEFEVVLAVDGANGWDVIQRDPDIQVIFTDLVMPEMDGFEVLKAIRTCENERINSLPVIVATGADNPEMAKQKAISLGATDFITKPFNATAMRARAVSYARLHQTAKTLQRQTTLDTLTGLLNNQGLQHQLSKDISFVARHHSTLPVLTVQIDGFKDLFIRIGRSGSEAVIKKIANLLKETVRKEDAIARTGIASFIITMPLAQIENALELSDRLCRNVESLRVRLDGKKLDITVSIGICKVEPGNNVNVADVLDCADYALRKALELGRSQMFMSAYQEYLCEIGKHGETSISMDYLLNEINQGNSCLVNDDLDRVAELLSPLVKLLSKEQKQRLLA